MDGRVTVPRAVLLAVVCLVLPIAAQAHEATILPGYAYSTWSASKPGCHVYDHRQDGTDFIELETRRGETPCRVTYRVRIPDGAEYQNAHVGALPVAGHGALLAHHVVGRNTVRVVVKWYGRAGEFSEVTIDWIEVIWR